MATPPTARIRDRSRDAFASVVVVLAACVTPPLDSSSDSSSDSSTGPGSGIGSVRPNEPQPELRTEEALDAPERLPSSLAALGRIAAGERVALDDAVLFVPEDFAHEGGTAIPLYVHFQGGAAIAEENFVRMERGGVLIASTLSGFSSAFAEPYRDPAVFEALLASGERALAERIGSEVHFQPITITFFSAGYGAVRELLEEPRLFERIDALVSADSIYASVVAPDVRAPLAEQMTDFMRFAQAAARGEKTFVLAHGMYQTDYASTAECADLVLASVAARREASDAFTERGVPIASEAHVGGFHLYTFDEADAGIHVDCLYMIPQLVRLHVPE